MTDCHLANRVNLLRELIEDAYAAKGVTDDPATWGSEMVLVVLLESTGPLAGGA